MTGQSSACGTNRHADCAGSRACGCSCQCGCHQVDEILLDVVAKDGKP